MGYPCLSLHGGKEQTDRESTISDFKGNVCNILVATSIAARGLDVKDLVLVVNYDVPDHYEDYVHRVGRTGRAGQQGTAITFLDPASEDKFAPDLVRALRESGQPVPQDLQALADEFVERRKAGLVQGHGSGYGGSGFKFDKSEENIKREEQKAIAKGLGLVVEEEPVDDEDRLFRQDDDFGAHEDDPSIRPVTAGASVAAVPPPRPPPGPPPADSMTSAVAQASASLRGPGAAPAPAAPSAIANVAASLAAQLAARLPAMGMMGMGMAPFVGLDPAAAAAAAAAAAGPTAFQTEVEINDFHQRARWRVTHRERMRDINELTGCAVIVRGKYFKPGEPIPDGERKLYLLIEGPSGENRPHPTRLLCPGPFLFLLPVRVGSVGRCRHLECASLPLSLVFLKKILNPFSKRLDLIAGWEGNGPGFRSPPPICRAVRFLLAPSRLRRGCRPQGQGRSPKDHRGGDGKGAALRRHGRAQQHCLRSSREAPRW